MARLTGQLTAAAAIVGLAAGTAAAQTPAHLTTPVHQSARLLTLGSIAGSVIDEHGGALAGAIVSALGPASSAMATTDAHGEFVISALPPGDYAVRVHLVGFAAARRDAVRVGTAASSVDRIQLRRLDAAPLESRPIMAAGIVPVGDSTTGDGDNHSETAWRLRHIKRSVLKQDGSVVSIADAAAEQTLPAAQTSLFNRAVDGAATVATSFFTDTAFSGEVNLLTTSAVGNGSLFTTDLLPRGIAYVSIGAPSAAGRWDVRASMSQSDLAAWILAGSFSSRLSTNHNYGFGVSYGTQQAQPRTAPAAAGPPEDARSVGEIYGGDRWSLTHVVALEYSARYAWYDYLNDRSLLSPRVGVDLTPLANTHVIAAVSQRMLAPGEEEFIAPSILGPWLPPERTFGGLDGENMRVERVRMIDLGVNHEFQGAYILSVRRFQQTVDDQLTTIFDAPTPTGSSAPGYYSVASAGGLDADGWSARLSSAPTQRIRGSVAYTVTRANWTSRGDTAAIAVWAPEAIRPTRENVHDLTTSLETDIPETATRVFVLYAVNSSFARRPEAPGSPFESRFDVQVNQALPFTPFGTARWEVLLGVRNLFRDPSDAGSVYDELLVIRPPKRVLGGVLIRF